MKKSKDYKQKEKQRHNMFSNALFSQLPEFNFWGNEEVVIEGSRGVLEYSQDLIRVNTTLGVVCFCGRSLNLRCISPSELIIDGFITKVEFVI